MDDSRSRQFFVQPVDVLHRRYEALRTFFVEGRSIPNIAEQFGYTPATVYSLVRDFRVHTRAGAIPPFSYNHSADDRRGRWCRRCRAPKSRPSPTHAA